MALATWLGACAPTSQPPAPTIAAAPAFQRAAYSGTRQRLDFLTTLRPDCSYMGPSDYHFPMHPQHGSIELRPVVEPPMFLQNSIYFKCNDRRVHGVMLYYTPDRFYGGQDHFVMEWISPAGLFYRRAYDVVVK